jgi:TRAP-type transport system periplasmic protein
MGSKRLGNCVLVLIVSFGLGFILFSPGSSALAADQPIKWNALSSWGTDQAQTRLFFVPLVDRINKKAAGRLQVSWVGPEAVPPFEQLKPLRAGLFDVLFSSPSYHMGEVSLGVGMTLFKGSAKDRRAAGFYQIEDEAYKKVDAKILGLNCYGVGFIIQLKKEIKTADLKGLKIRTTPSYEPLIKALNGSAVRLATGEIYSSLEKGVIDGACQTALGSIDMKLYEVAKFQLRPQYGEVVDHCLVNASSWAKLPKDLQDVVTQAAIEVEEEARNNMIAMLAKAEVDLAPAGFLLNVLPPAEGEKIVKAYYDHSWDEVVIKFNPDLGPKMKKIADEFIKTHKQ